MQRDSDRQPASTGILPVPRLIVVSRRLVPALLAAVCMAAGAHAVELGELRIHSSPGQQLRASIPLAGDDAAGSEGRCFNGVLLRPDGRQAGTLKVAFQRSAGGAMLLLAAAGTGAEAVIAVRVENTCGTGANRDYPVTLVAANESAQAASAALPAAITHVDTAQEAPTKKLQKALAEEKALSRKLKSIEAKLATALSGSEATALVRGPVSAGRDAAPLVLKLERSLAAAVTSADVPVSLPAWTEADVGALLLLLIASTGAWVSFRLRQSDAPSGQWMPADPVT